MLDRIKQLFIETYQKMDANLIELGGEDHQVHCLVSVPPKVDVANLVGKLKGKTSYFLRKEFAKQLRQKLCGKHL